MCRLLTTWIFLQVSWFICTSQPLTPFDPLKALRGDAWEKAYQLRLQHLLNSQTFTVDIKDANTDADAGKRVWPPLLAQLYKAQGDTAKIQQLIQTTGQAIIDSKWAGNFYKPFTLPGYTMYYFRFKNQLPAAQLEYTRKHLYDKGWDYLMRGDGHMDPIYLPPEYPNGTEFNSENFNWMARMGGYLFAQEYHDADKLAYFDGYLNNWIRCKAIEGPPSHASTSRLP